MMLSIYGLLLGKVTYIFYGALYPRFACANTPDKGRLILKNVGNYLFSGKPISAPADYLKSAKALYD